MGSSAFAGEILLNLLSLIAQTPNCQLTAIYTKSPSRKNRGQKISDNIVLDYYQKAKPQFTNNKIFTPKNFTAAEFSELTSLQPDLILVASYGLILPPALLTLPRLGAINFHASLLPKWRGAAPIERAIAAGDKKTGVCLMLMAAGLDTGDILQCQELIIDSDANRLTLSQQLAKIAGQLLTNHWQNFLTGNWQRQPQQNSLASYAEKIIKSEFLLQPNTKSAIFLERQIRALFPKCYLPIKQQRLLILKTKILPTINPSELSKQFIQLTKFHPNLFSNQKQLLLQTIDGFLEIIELQPSGKKPMLSQDWLRGQRVR